MKKAILTLIIFLIFITGCKNKVIHDDQGNIITPEPTSESEKTLYMIQQAIDDYNDDKISEREIEWNTTISPLPIEIKEIPQISSLNTLKDIKIEDRITNTVFDGAYVLDKYIMIFEIYNFGNNFWLNGKTSFQVDVKSILVNNPEFTEIKTILDSLLKDDLDILASLYGIDVELGEESSTYPGFYKLLSTNKFNYKTIAELKEKAESIFTSEFLLPYYEVSFENEDPIYREIDGILYCSMSDSDIFDGLPYDTTRIVAIE